MLRARTMRPQTVSFVERLILDRTTILSSELWRFQYQRRSPGAQCCQIPGANLLIRLFLNTNSLAYFAGHFLRLSGRLPRFPPVYGDHQGHVSAGLSRAELLAVRMRFHESAVYAFLLPLAATISPTFQGRCDRAAVRALSDTNGVRSVRFP